MKEDLLKNKRFIKILLWFLFEKKMRFHLKIKGSLKMYIDFFLKIKHASLERTVPMPAPAKLVRAVSRPNKIDSPSRLRFIPEADCNWSSLSTSYTPACWPHRGFSSIARNELRLPQVNYEKKWSEVSESNPFLVLYFSWNLDVLYVMFK